MKNASDNGSAVDLIGQFGVGFYSAFMVADKVEILTRRAGEDKAWFWVSNGVDGFEIREAEKKTNGTEIKLFLKQDEKNYTDSIYLRQIIRTYSDHINYPIVLCLGKAGEETVNSASALWTRNKAEITPEQYKEFYHHVSKNFDEPWMTLHFNIADDIAFTQGVDVSVEHLERLLSIIHELEPTGVGARNLQECLLLQLDQENLNTRSRRLARKIVECYFDEFVKKHYEKLKDYLIVIAVRDKENRDGNRILRPHPCFFSCFFVFQLFFMLYHQLIDPLNRIQQLADRGIVVQGINEQSNIFAHIAVYIIFFLQKLIRLVHQIGGEQSVEITSREGFVEFFHSICEESEGGAHEDLTCSFVLQKCGNFQHAVAGGDHVINNDHILARNIGSQKLMGNDRIAAVNDSGGGVHRYIRKAGRPLRQSGRTSTRFCPP